MKVIVTANKNTGLVFTQNANPGKDGKIYGYVRVESSQRVENNGFLAVKTISALIPMSKESFDAAPLKAGEELGGQIIVLESLEQKPGYQPKLAGESGTPCLLDGRQIYRTTKWTTDMSAESQTIKHNNVIVGSSIKANANDALNG